MAKNFIQPGNVLEFTNTSTAPILSGDAVPVSDIIGVATTTILPGETGNVQMEGVFLLPKKVGDVLTQGSIVYWSDAGVTKTETPVKAGRVWVEEKANATSVAIKLVIS